MPHGTFARMPTLMTLSCPYCGGALELTSRADLFKCAHCRRLALLHWSAEAPQPAKLEPKATWKANLLRPDATLNWQGGELLLTADELAFVPHAINFGPIEKAVVPLASIARLELATGVISDEVTITDARGERWGVRVFRGKEVSDAIEAARR